ncbi:MAG: nucleotidyltransferase domain-containing protein [Nitrososphaeria archaeon]|nr:nucleotidyltransferase domain-containing protein [Nitrososphaeria archaeon]
MEKYIDILLERAKMVREWKTYMNDIVKAVKSILPDSKIYVFGSVVKGEAVAGSDIDILIFSKNVPKTNIDRAKIKLEIEKLSKLPQYHPFELHLANEEDMKWYTSRVKEIIEWNFS